MKMGHTDQKIYKGKEWYVHCFDSHLCIPLSSIDKLATRRMRSNSEGAFTWSLDGDSPENVHPNELLTVFPLRSALRWAPMSKAILEHDLENHYRHGSLRHNSSALS